MQDVSLEMERKEKLKANWRDWKEFTVKVIVFVHFGDSKSV